MKVVVITSSKKDNDEIVALVKMLEAGLGTLHVRKPRFSKKEMAEFIQAIPAHFHNRLVIHSHHRLATRFKLQGIHYTSIHLKKKFRLWWTTKLAGIKNPNLIKSLSYRRLSDVYLKEKVEPDYCFIGTLFHNITGELYSGFYHETIIAANQKSGKKLIARGGVNEKSVELAYKLGFYGVALYGDLWKHSDPFSRYIGFLKYCREREIPLE